LTIANEACIPFITICSSAVWNGVKIELIRILHIDLSSKYIVVKNNSALQVVYSAKVFVL